MKHVLYIKFMATLWRAYDRLEREIGTGYVSNGRAYYFDSPVYSYFTESGVLIPPNEVIDDVNNQIDILNKMM